MDNQVQWDKESRVQRAKDLFMSGFNCSQSVVAAFADLYGFTQEQALKMSAAFGGGIGRMRETCGAACGMFQLAGLEKGATEGPDRESKKETYALVQQLAAAFKAHAGSIKCAEILKLRQGESLIPTPEARTPDYYAKRPCVKMVELAARMWADYYESVKK